VFIFLISLKIKCQIESFLRNTFQIRQQNTPEIAKKKQKIRECLERCIRQSDISSSQHQLGMGRLVVCW